MTKKKISAKKSTPTASKPAAKPLKKAPAKKSAPVIAKKKLPIAISKSKPILKKPVKKIAPAKPSKTAPAANKKKPVSKKLVPVSKKVVLKTKPAPLSKTKAPAKAPVKTSKAKVQALPPKSVITRGALQQTFVTRPIKQKKKLLSPFLTKQRQRLLMLKDTLLDSMTGVARANLRSGGDASGFGMHQADAGSDAYDRDFALSILSQEQNSLYEIDEALKRIDDDTYGICEISNKQISHARLEARPFTRYTVECQAELEKRQHVSGARVPVSALFGITEEETENEEEEGFNENPKD